MKIAGLHQLKVDGSRTIEDQIQRAEMQKNCLEMNSMMTNDGDYMGEDEKQEEKEQGKLLQNAFCYNHFDLFRRA